MYCVIAVGLKIPGHLWLATGALLLFSGGYIIRQWSAPKADTYDWTHGIWHLCTAAGYTCLIISPELQPGNYIYER